MAEERPLLEGPVPMLALLPSGELGVLDEQRAVWLGVIELVTCGVLGSQIQEEGLDLASGRLLAQCHSKST